ncbi:hypothetical protein [Verrucomicrobium sp. 3C]|uniref:hypothetical protein n=1 Tax=Verrucomicrobium sp. 3C TaxID=1134055 RepID=UPI00035FBC8C|nr:hypothetical protein [Verrucomicrobium sp. 3C]
MSELAPPRVDLREPSALVGILAGARIWCNRTIAGLPQLGYHDLDVEVAFLSRNDPEALPRHGKGAAAVETIPLPDATGLTGWIAKDGGWGAIEEDPNAPQDRAVSIRRVLPFLAALQERVTLHAAATASAAGVFAFVGESGAGKSTLSRCLAELGWRIAADDLLPCRTREGVVTVPLDEDRSLPLRGIYFLSRKEGLPCVRRIALPGADCLKRLLVHGFGEIAVRKAWAAQFGLYEKIARTVPAYNLVEPDALPRLRRNALEVSALLDEPAAQSACRLGSG